MSASSRAAWLGIAASVVLHVGLAVVLIRLPTPATTGEELAFEVEILPGGPEQDGRAPATPAGTARSTPVPLEHGGARSAQNIDAADDGGGGDERGARSVILLFHRPDAITVQDSPLNTLAALQTQRIRTASDRATGDARRATPSPNDQPFLASGEGTHRERRPVSAIDPRAGAQIAPPGARRGSEAAAADARPEERTTVERGVALAEPGRARSDEATGTDRESPGRGIAGGRGERESEAARVAHGRPPVDRGPAATPAHDVGRVRDNQSSELLAARLVQSMVEATERRGRRDGSGSGGAGGGGAPGAGVSSREGGRASPHGPGTGAFASLDTSDRRYVRWFLEQRARVKNRLEFPRERMLRMDQGTTVCRVHVRRDGSLAEPPEMVRSSGFGDFDEAALAAIRAAAPFGPVPRDLAPGVPVLSVMMPIRFHNPMVGN